MAPKPHARFAIRMIDGGNFADLPAEYDDPRFAEVLRTAKLGAVVIDEGDVERFAESPVAFVLTEEASRRIARDLQSRELRLEDKPFVVTLGDERLVAGVCLYVGSARAVRIPVLYVDDRAPRLVLWLRPQHGGWYDRPVRPPELAARVARPQLLEHFRALGKESAVPGAAAAPSPSFETATAAVAEAEAGEARGDFTGALDAAGRALAALGGDYAPPGTDDDTGERLAAAAVARDAGDLRRAASTTLEILRARVAMYRERHPDAPRDPRVLALSLEIQPSPVVLGKPMRAVVTLANRGAVPVLANARLAANADHAPPSHRELSFQVIGPHDIRYGFVSKVRIGAPDAADIVVLAPGEKRSNETDIVRDHGLTEAGRYQVRAFYQSAPVADADGHPVWAGRLESNETTFELTR
jgi:hypothetical protein